MPEAETCPPNCCGDGVGHYSSGDVAYAVKPPYTEDVAEARTVVGIDHVNHNHVDYSKPH